MPSSARRTLTLIEGLAGSSMLAGGDARLRHHCVTLWPPESCGAAAHVIPGAPAAILTGLLTENGLYLAAGAEPPRGAHTLIDVNALSSMLAGGRAERCQTLLSAVS